MEECKPDFIVIGSGASGSVIANRLSKYFRVLLLEQGSFQNDNPIVFNPANAFIADNIPNINLDFTSIRQATLDGSQLILSQGQGIGGTTLHYYMLTSRPSIRYLQGLEQLFGEAFRVEDSLKYYRKIETYVPQPGSPTDPSRGKHGPWINTQLPIGNFTLGNLDGVPHASTITSLTDPASLTFQLTQEVNGFRATPMLIPDDDYNSAFAPPSPAVSRIDAYLQQHPGEPLLFTRTQTGEAFLGPKIVNPQTGTGSVRELKVITFARVVKILLQKKSNQFRAEGVKYLDVNSRLHKVRARLGVILAGGAVGSPWLAQLSGIGPRDVLEAAGVETLLDLPTGENYHFHYGPTWYLFSPSASYAQYSSSLIFPQVLPAEPLPPPYPPNYVPPRMYEIIPDSMPTTNGFLIEMAAWLVNPLSNGTVKILTKNAWTLEPSIDPQLYTNPNDFTTIRNYSLGLSKAVAAANANGADLSWVTPDPGTLGPALDATIQSLSQIVTHGVGTCAIDRVVDRHFKVFGTENLYICDLSVLPIHPDANTGSTASVLGEKLVHHLKREYGRL